MKQTVLFFLLVSFTFVTNGQSPLVHYPFNGNGNDLSGNQYDATYINATPTTDRFGTANSAYQFNGTDQIIRMPVNASLKPNLPFSVSLWVKFDNLNEYKSAVFTNEHKTNFYSGFWIGVNGGKVHLSYGDLGDPGPFSRRTVLSNTTINTSTWYHITAVVKGPNDMELYVIPFNNASSACNLSNSTWVYQGTGGGMQYFGSSYAGTFGLTDASDTPTLPIKRFQGKIDDFKMWNRALTVTQIEEECQGNSNPPNLCNNSENHITDNGNGSFTAAAAQAYYWEIIEGNANITGSHTGQSVSVNSNGGSFKIKLTRFNLGECIESCKVSSYTPVNQCPNKDDIILFEKCNAALVSISNVANVSHVNWSWVLGGYSGNINNGNTYTHIIYPPGNWYNHYIAVYADVVFTDGTVCSEVRKTFLINCSIGGVPLDLPRLNTEENIKISPNPSQGIFNIQSNKNTNISEVTILNSQGKSIRQSSNFNSKTTLDLSNENSGIYFLKIQFEDGSSKTEKLVLTR